MIISTTFIKISSVGILLWDMNINIINDDQQVTKDMSYKRGGVSDSIDEGEVNIFLSCFLLLRSILFSDFWLSKTSPEICLDCDCSGVFRWSACSSVLLDQAVVDLLHPFNMLLRRGLSNSCCGKETFIKDDFQHDLSNSSRKSTKTTPLTTSRQWRSYRQRYTKCSKHC